MSFSRNEQSTRPSARRCKARAFSLMELMIAIVILGMGMIMVASIYPVAWERARALTEFTTQQTVTNAAQTIVESLVRVSGATKGSSSFMGDLIYDEGDPVAGIPVQYVSTCQPPAFNPVAAAHGSSDTWVHALNLENVAVEGRDFVSEDSWIGQIPDNGIRADLDPVNGNGVTKDYYENSYFRSRTGFHQRIQPPLGPRPPDSEEERDQWENELATRRFAWSVLHRLRTPITVDTISTTRSIDLYYVTLRRPNSTLRYAQQDPGKTPNPCDLMNNPIIQPQAKPSKEDLMFPVPWRVQIEFPGTLVNKFDPLTNEPGSTGIPTEVTVPPAGMTDAGTGVMLVQMFPKGAQFVDEITGQLYSVVQRRITGAQDETATLTLDREVFIEDIDLPAGDARCDTGVCRPGEAVPFELIRTVWVYPPPVQDDDTTTPGPRLFDGSQPVVGIDIRTVHLAASM